MGFETFLIPLENVNFRFLMYIVLFLFPWKYFSLVIREQVSPYPPSACAFFNYQENCFLIPPENVFLIFPENAHFSFPRSRLFSPQGTLSFLIIPENVLFFFPRKHVLFSFPSPREHLLFVLPREMFVLNKYCP